MSIEEFIDKCIETNQYFGLGNPESNILFVGKEAVGMEIGEECKHGTGISWKEEKANIYSRRYIPTDKNLLDGKHTCRNIKNSLS